MRKRWYKENIQDITDLDLSKEPFAFTNLQRRRLDSKDNSTLIPQSYMKDILKAFPSLPSTIRLDQTVITKKCQYEEFTGLSKQIAERLQKIQ